MKIAFRSSALRYLAIVLLAVANHCLSESMPPTENETNVVALMDTATQARLTLADDSTAMQSGRDIMAKVYNQTKKHPSQEFDMTMVIQNKDHKKRERHFTLSKKHNEEITKSLIHFYKPANIKGSKLLTHADEDKETNQWMFIPAFKSIKQIQANEKDSSFMGSDFSYSDIAGRRLDQDHHQLIGSDDKYYYITSTPKSSDDTYSKLNIIVDKSHYVIVKIDFYRNDKPYKKLINTKISQYGNIFIATESTMVNLASKGQSIIEINNFVVDAQFDSKDLEIKSLH